MWRSVQSAVQRADMLKYFLMHSIGGMYMDLDAECWRPVDATLQGADIVLQASWRQRGASAWTAACAALGQLDSWNRPLMVSLVSEGACCYASLRARTGGPSKDHG